jgi:hypothetical protein
LSEEELLVWLLDSPDRPSYQQRLTIWLTWTKALHAEEVAQVEIWSIFGRCFEFNVRCSASTIFPCSQD